MTQRSKWTPWKKDRLFTIKLRNGHYALLQMLEPKGQIAAFDSFQDVDDWSGVRLTADRVMFTGTLLRSVTNRSVIAIHKNVVPVSGLEYAEDRIDIGGGFRTVTLWEGTEDERSFLMMGEGKNCLRRIHWENDQPREEYSPISLDDFELYKDVRVDESL